jgi:predicted Ser/Thr protein kinase
MSVSDVDPSAGEATHARTDPLGDTELGRGEASSSSGRSRPFAKREMPQRVGRYRIVDKLGEGGMGLVYVAHDDDLDRRVAIKILRPEGDGDPKRLLREARSMARLCHPNIAAVYDVGTHADGVYVAMEYVDGPSLRAWLETPRPWSDRAITLLQAAEGLDAAHQAGLVHRDFKPENVVVGADARVRVLDFGLAKLVPGDGAAQNESTTTRAGALVGTPRYMAPEQLRAHTAGPPADQFAFCLTAYEVAYGERAFGGDVFAELAASVLREDPRPPPETPDVPAQLWPVLRRGLSRAPEDRYPDMSALIDDLRRLSVVTAAPARIVSRPALHDAREQAREQLASGFAKDFLDADELDERLDQLEYAADEEAVARLVADLAPNPKPTAALVPADTVAPVPALQPTRPARIFSIFSSAERRGQWTPAPHTQIIAAFGSAEIDLRDATLPPGGIQIEVRVGFGSVEIFVPPGVPVDLECLAIFGSAEQEEPSSLADPSMPRIRVTGFVAFGSVEVVERLPGEGFWAARKRRKAGKKALREAARKALPPSS